MFLVDVITPYLMQHNSEPEAVDLLMEVEKLEKLVPHSNETNYKKVCQYLEACSYYAADGEEMITTLKVAYNIYKNNRKYPEAMRIAQRINSMDLMIEIMDVAKVDPVV
jgi:26S proteasome regulatory subunit N1